MDVLNVKLTDYLPAISEIDSATVKDARARLVTYAQLLDSTLDTRPNSVFGDLAITPLSQLIAAFEIAANRIFSDVDLANVAAGTVYNCEFVAKYLDNFGLGQRAVYPSTGVIELSFTVPKTYVLDGGTKFLFTGEDDEVNEEYAYEISGATSTTTIYNPATVSDPDASWKPLIKRDDNTYVVYLPVEGPAGVQVNAGAEAETNIAITELQGATAISDFDMGTLPENVMELARKSQSTFYASSLNNRSGAISFLLQTYPELQGISPVISGDTEMVRDRQNVLGVMSGEMDIHIKSRSTFRTEVVPITLSYDTANGWWHGGIDKTLGGAPALIDEVTIPDNITEELVSIVGRSNDTNFPNLTCSYSSKEDLGVRVTTVDPLVADQTDSLTFVANTALTAVGVNTSITGTYIGGQFGNADERDITVSFLNVVDGELNAQIHDGMSGTTLQVVFEQTPSVPEAVIKDPEASGYNDLLNGIDFKLDLTSVVGATTALKYANGIALSVGKSEQFNAKSTSKLFMVQYQIDPLLPAIETLVTHADVHPVNTNLAVKGFYTCLVDDLTVTYRRRSGSIINTEQALSDIVRYINGLAYPYVYEEHKIAEILMYYGAEGVKSVTQSGQIFSTLADTYILDDGSTQTLNHPMTTTLLAPNNIDGLGSRNLHYILSSDRVKFNAITI
jgi:hypothetical protein